MLLKLRNQRIRSFITLPSSAAAGNSSSRNDGKTTSTQKLAFNSAKEILRKATSEMKNKGAIAFLNYETHLAFNAATSTEDFNRLLTLPPAPKTVEVEGKNDTNPTESEEEDEKFITAKVFREMHRHRFDRFTGQMTYTEALKTNVLGDCFVKNATKSPTELPVQIEVRFPPDLAYWLGAYGQAVDPSQTTSSPEVSLNIFQSETSDTSDTKNDRYTLLMSNLDATCLETKSYDEWCHWLVTDIQIENGRLVIPASPSKYLKKENDTNQELDSPESTTPSKFGNTIFDYVPPHPTLSNPKTVHRYVLSVWKQPDATDSTFPTISSQKLKWTENAQWLRSLASKLPAHQKMVEGPAELAMEYRERFAPLPTLKLASDHGLELSGYGFFTSSFNALTSPAVFSSLGLHQPVYGKIRQETTRHLVQKMEAASQIAASLPTNLQESSKDAIKALNNGQAAILLQPKLLTRRSLKTIEKKTAAEKILVEKALSMKDKDKSKGKGKDKGKVVETVSFKEEKIVKLGVYGAAALVKQNPKDVAFKYKGSLINSIKTKTNRFSNA